MPILNVNPRSFLCPADDEGDGFELLDLAAVEHLEQVRTARTLRVAMALAGRSAKEVGAWLGEHNVDGESRVDWDAAFDDGGWAEDLAVAPFWEAADFFDVLRNGPLGAALRNLLSFDASVDYFGVSLRSRADADRLVDLLRERLGLQVEIEFDQERYDEARI